MRALVCCVLLVCFSSFCLGDELGKTHKFKEGDLPRSIAAKARDVIEILMDVKPNEVKDFNTNSDNPDVKVRAVNSEGVTKIVISGDKKGEHHGYADRARPPVFVRSYAATPETESVLQTDHAIVRLRFHIVLASWHRRGVFGQASAEAVSDRWRQLQTDLRLRVDKVSFVPDHVHLSVALHPAVDPASVVVALMNAGQEVLWSRFDRDVIQAGVERLWQPSAYVGSFGDLKSNAISAYVSRWERDTGD